MVKIRIKTENIKNTAKQVLNKLIPLVAYAALGYVTIKTKDYFSNEIIFDNEIVEESSENTDYGRAVKAIVNSDMTSDDKTKALAGLKHNKGYYGMSYYESVIAIAKGTMTSHNKCEAICRLD